MTDLATRITLYRARHDLTKKDFGALVGVSSSTVCKWESGRNKPSYGNVKRIEALFHDDQISHADILWCDDADGQIGMILPDPTHLEGEDDGDPRIWGVVLMATLVFTVLLGVTIWRLA